jgi:hypothetical protein
MQNFGEWDCDRLIMLFTYVHEEARTRHFNLKINENASTGLLPDFYLNSVEAIPIHFSSCCTHKIYVCIYMYIYYVYNTHTHTHTYAHMYMASRERKKSCVMAH